MAEARWYLLAGATGAGKTTVARELAKRIGAVRFSIDEWMTSLYWMDCPEKKDYPWAIERVRRCEEQIAAVAEQLAGLGVGAVLDLGFTQRDQRQAWLQRARAANIGVELHIVDVAAEVRWQRVVERNTGASATYSFAVSREMFDAMEAMWELPGSNERVMFDCAEI